jgi:hypothetical protein
LITPWATQLTTQLAHALPTTDHLSGNGVDFDVHTITHRQATQRCLAPRVGNEIDINLNTVVSIEDLVNGEAHTLQSD